MATLLKYKKGLKRPTLAWSEMSFVTVVAVAVVIIVVVIVVVKRKASSRRFYTGFKVKSYACAYADRRRTRLISQNIRPDPAYHRVRAWWFVLYLGSVAILLPSNLGAHALIKEEILGSSSLWRKLAVVSKNKADNR